MSMEYLSIYLCLLKLLNVLQFSVYRSLISLVEFIPRYFIFFDAVVNGILKNYLFIYLFIGCIGSSLLHAGFLYLQREVATLSCSAWASHCGGFSCCGAQALGSQVSVVVAHRL